MTKNFFYITTTLPYVNSDPHMGFALELVHADIIARYQRLMGNEVFFNTGTDEHGLKIYRKALEAKRNPQEYVDEYAQRFQNLKGVLNISWDNFIRTTDPHHKKAAQEFWKRCIDAGDIYKKNYKVKYCVGCELEKTDSELEKGRCPIHPNLDTEIIEEENYFFKFSKHGERLLAFYDDNPDFVIPATRLGEIKKFAERGLQDFSISRLKSKMPWGVPVPGDENQVMYVWFDALVNYISCLGWPENEDNFRKWWPGIQIAGKDNVRQQSAMWQAMLMSAKLPPSKQIIIHGFITSGGQKMSKSLGNVVDPLEIVKEYGTDALRYYLARHVNTFEDSDFTKESFKEAYNSHLANGLGNLVSRIMKMAETHLSHAPVIPDNTIPDDFKNVLSKYEIQKALNIVWQWISDLDRSIQELKPFVVVKEDAPKGKKIISEMVIKLYTIGRMLNPIMPEVNDKIKRLVKENKMPEAPLFIRKD